MNTVWLPNVINVWFFAKGCKAVFVQNLVKRFDGRFKTNYTIEGGEQYIQVEFRDADNYVKFDRMMRVVNMKYF